MRSAEIERPTCDLTTSFSELHPTEVVKHQAHRKVSDIRTNDEAPKSITNISTGLGGVDEHAYMREMIRPRNTKSSFRRHYKKILVLNKRLVHTLTQENSFREGF